MPSTKSPAENPGTVTEKYDGFTAEERVAMKEHAPRPSAVGWTAQRRSGTFTDHFRMSVRRRRTQNSR